VTPRVTLRRWSYRGKKHEVMAWECEQYLKFTDMCFNRSTVPNPVPLP
jgi:hypothetical protein